MKATKKPVLQPVVLSGGSGLRLWPLSRPDAPKQLIPLVDDRSMLLTTLMRLDGLEDVLSPLVVCNAAHTADVHRDLDIAGRGGRIIVEPSGRNTAPAVAAAALASPDEAVLLVMPADHLIRDVGAFHDAVAAGIGPAAGGELVTFGIVPDGPATGYGYIKSTAKGPVRHVDRFVEKPDLATAEGFIASGEYLWNSGMFMFTAGGYLHELTHHAPDIAAAVREAIGLATERDAELLLESEAFVRAPAISIDYAVMEHTRRAAVVPLDAGWTDLGSFESLHEIGVPDTDHNVRAGRVVLQDTTNSYVRSEGPLVGTIGVDHMVVVATPDAVLVADRSAGQEIKALVGSVVELGHDEGSTAAMHLQSWGRRTHLATGQGVRAFRLDVLPSACVELEAGTTIVIAGGGSIDGRSILPGDVVTVEPGTAQRLSNAGPGILVAIAALDTET